MGVAVASKQRSHRDGGDDDDDDAVGGIADSAVVVVVAEDTRGTTRPRSARTRTSSFFLSNL